MGDFIGTTISGLTGRGSIRHNNRSFTAANVDRSRTGQNVTFCNEDLKQVYHEVFDEALAAYEQALLTDGVVKIAADNRAVLLDGSDPLFEWIDEEGARDPGLVPYSKMPQR